MPVNNLKVDEDRKKLVEAVIKDMEDGVPFFWNSGHYGTLNRPRNLKNSLQGKEKPYKGINAMTLMFYGMQKGYKDARWCTFKQAEELGFKIIKGETGIPIEYWEFSGPKKEYNKKTKKWEPVYEVGEDGIKRQVYVKYHRPMVRRYIVFNAEQMEGVPPLEIPLTISDKDRNIYFENMLENSEAPIFYDQSSRNYYSPTMDEIHVMPREQFKDMDFFYSTVAHEIAHSTGAANRNNRPGITGFTGFGSETYAKEELVAEMSAMFLASEYGLSLDMDHMENHKAYLRSWVKALKEDPDELFRAASQAEQAVDYIKEKMLLKDIELVQYSDISINPLDISIHDYYINAYPSDDLGERLADITFREFYESLKKHEDVYDVIGVGDSEVRVRLFQQLAKITGKDYSDIYNLAMGISEEPVPIKYVDETPDEKAAEPEKVEDPKKEQKKKLAEKVTDAWAEENLPTKGLPDSLIEMPKLPTYDIAQLGDYYEYLRKSYLASTPREEVDFEVIRHMKLHGLKDNRISTIYKNNAAKFADYPSSQKVTEILKSSELWDHANMTSFKEEMNSLIDDYIKTTNKQLTKNRAVNM